MSLDPSVAAVRLAVRPVLGESGGTVLVACSGGADSLALLAGTVFEGHKLDVHVVGVTVDHGLQDGSVEHASRVVAQMASLGADETVSVSVRVEASGQGPEAAAREARYAVLAEVADRMSAGRVLLGHTLDDQAETVLLGLARGSGARSLAGMRRGFDQYSRPLLDLTRAQTEAACRAVGIEFWSDPHNDDPRFTRSRVRHQVLPVLEAELGPGVAAALARTADQLRRDTRALDDIAERVLAEEAAPSGRVCSPGPPPDGSDAGVSGEEDSTAGLRVSALERQPEAVLFRVLRLAALAAGAHPSELTYGQILAVSELVLGPEGASRHKQIQLPGHVTAHREGNLLRFRRTRA